MKGHHLKRLQQTTHETYFVSKSCFGRLAQLVERYPYKVDVISSSLIATTITMTQSNKVRFATLTLCFTQREAQTTSRFKALVREPAVEANPVLT